MNVSSVPKNRKNRARKWRRDAVQVAFARRHAVNENNGEEFGFDHGGGDDFCGR